jgi:phosphatidate phosphatase PAH1
MQYVRSISGSVSKTWNSINPATLSGAIDVIVIEQEDGTLACSPFHVRFGKFSLLRPYEKKVPICCPGEFFSDLTELDFSSGGISSQWSQAGLCDEARGGRRGLFRL